MHAKPDLRVVLKWKIVRSGSVIVAVILLESLGMIGCRNCADIMLGKRAAETGVGTFVSADQRPVATERGKTNIQSNDGFNINRVVVTTYCCLPPRFPQKSSAVMYTLAYLDGTSNWRRGRPT